MSTVPLPEQFRLFAQGAAKDGATTYDVICRGVADDPDILALIGEAPLRQRRPNLLLAAVHFLLLSGTHIPLRGTTTPCGPCGGRGESTGGAGGAVGGDSGDNPQGPPHSDLVADFKDFCLKHRAELLELLATEARRPTRSVAAPPSSPPSTSSRRATPGQPLSLLDLGTSAGLNLLFDSYDYTYRQRDGGAVLTLGRADAKVHLECTVRGELSDLPPLSLPPVAGRFGIDAAPIDPTSDDGAHWLLACLWPDNLARFTRLREALAIARTTPHPPEVYRGDIIDDLPAVVDRHRPLRPAGRLPFLGGGLPQPRRQGTRCGRRDTPAATRPGRSRTVHYLYAEAPIETPGLPTPPSPSPRPTSHLATALVHLAPDGSPPVRLADMHHHGNWLQWWPTATDPTVRLGGPEPAPRSSVTMEAAPLRIGRTCPRMASTAAVASCHDCSSDVALCVPSSRPSPRSKDSWSPPPSTRPEALTPSSLIPSPGSIAGQKGGGHLPDRTAGGDGAGPRCASGSARTGR